MDITAATATLTAGGAVGASGDLLDTNVTNLNVDTHTANGNQYLNEARRAE